MEAAKIYAEHEASCMEIRSFLEAGLDDIKNGNLLDVQTVFDELEKSCDAGG